MWEAAASWSSWVIQVEPACAAAELTRTPNFDFPTRSMQWSQEVPFWSSDQSPQRSSAPESQSAVPTLRHRFYSNGSVVSQGHTKPHGMDWRVDFSIKKSKKVFSNLVHGITAWCNSISQFARSQKLETGHKLITVRERGAEIEHFVRRRQWLEMKST